MSSNQIARQNEISNIELLRSSRVPRFRFIEDRLYFNHQMFSTKEKLSRLKEDLETLSTSKQLFESNWSALNSYIAEANTKIEERLNYLQSILNTYESEKQSTYAALEGQISKAKRKVAYVKSLTGSFSWVTSERFINFMMLNTSIDDLMNINTNSEECTLPIKNRDKVSIREIIIDNGSECIVGTPEGANNKTTNLLSTKEELGFSVYSTNGSMCKLVLDVELRREKVVNFISIAKNKNAKAYLKSIKDIIAYTKSGKSASIKKLCNSDLVFKESKDTLEFSFLPVKATSLRFIIEQDEAYYLDGIQIKQIDLDSIEIYGVRYSNEGKLESLDLNFGDYAAITTVVDRFPIDQNYNLEVSLKREDNNLALNIGEEPTLLESSPSFIKWQLSVSREITDNLVNLTDTSFYEYSTLIRPFNPSYPERFETEEQYYKQKVKAAHAIKGTLLDSDISTFELDLDDIQRAVPVFIYLENDGEPISIGNPQIPNENETRNLKIKSAFCKPIVTSIQNYYYFELGECFELNSIKYKYKDVYYRDLSIWESGGSIKGFAISKDILSFDSLSYKLETYEDQGDQANKYTFQTPIIQGTFLFQDGLGEGLEQKTYIDGSSEFSSLSGYVEEALNSQNVSPGSIIAFEPSETVSSAASAYLYKSGTKIADITFRDNVVVSSLAEDAPEIDTTTNVFYLKTSEPSFFSDYTIQYKYESQVNDASRYFSIDYQGGSIYFSHPVDETKRVRFETQTDDAIAEFDLAKYYDVEIDGNAIIIYDQDAYKKLRLNTAYIYLPKVGESINISDLEEYYSPILYSVELKAT